MPKTGGVAFSPTARCTGRGPGGARKVDDRGIEPRSTAVSERRLPSRPVVESALRQSLHTVVSGRDRPRSGCSCDFPRSRSRDQRFATCGQRGASPGNRTLLAGFTTRGLASSRATQSRREESNPRASTVGAWCSPLSYGEITPSTGVEPASPGRQPGRVSRRVRGRAVKYPERESNPRFRCERPASSTARRSGQDRCEAATAGVEPAFAG